MHHHLFYCIFVIKEKCVQTNETKRKPLQNLNWKDGTLYVRETVYFSRTTENETKFGIKNILSRKKVWRALSKVCRLKIQVYW